MQHPAPWPWVELTKGRLARILVGEIPLENVAHLIGELGQVFAELRAIPLIEMRAEISVELENPSTEFLEEPLQRRRRQATRDEELFDPRRKLLVKAALPINAQGVSIRLIFDAPEVEQLAHVPAEFGIHVRALREFDGVRKPPVAHFVRKGRDVGVRRESDAVLGGRECTAKFSAVDFFHTLGDNVLPAVTTGKVVASRRVSRFFDTNEL